jgi:hypothetical protein
MTRVVTLLLVLVWAGLGAAALRAAIGFVPVLEKVLTSGVLAVFCVAVAVCLLLKQRWAFATTVAVLGLASLFGSALFFVRSAPGTGGGWPLWVRALAAGGVFVLSLSALYLMLLNRRAFGFPEDDSTGGR